MVWDEGTVGIIEGIYDSVDTEQGWMPILETISSTYDTMAVNLFLRDSTTGEFVEDCLYGRGADEQDVYERLAHTDPSWPISAANPGKMINDVDHYGDSHFERTPPVQ